MSKSEILRSWLAISAVRGVGPLGAKRIAEACGGPVAAIRRGSAAWGRPVDVPLRELLEGADREIDRATALGLQLIALGDAAYPEALAAIPDPPLVLYVRGDATILRRESVAVVGARGCSPYGREQALRFGRGLALGGCVVVSGLALGVDAEAHRGALEAPGLTVAVLGSGVDRVYPARHRRLAAAIVEAGGALVSEFRLGTEPLPSNFPRRNRIVSGLCRAVVVVEASEASGSLITARLAADQGRDVYAVPGTAGGALSAGPHALLRQGAALAESEADVLGESFAGIEREVPNPSKFGPEATALWAALGDALTHVDDLSEASGLDAGAVLEALLRLELAGLIRQHPGLYFSRKLP